MPLNYLNIYLLGLLGTIAAIIGGIAFCYTGMTELGFQVYRGMEATTYYVDKNRYDLYMNGLVYGITFGAALLMFLAVIIIPSPEQIQRRMSATPFGTPAVGAPPSQLQAPGAEVEEPAFLEPELTPEIEDFGEDESLGLTGPDEEDSDVVNGTGRITDDAHVNFLTEHPESAVKFLMRKDLDDRPISDDEERVYEGWQKRGLSRGKLRKHVLKLMEWESIPDVAVNEIYSQIKEETSE